jgi:hypothetical protein
LISSPIRLLNERSNRQKLAKAEIDGRAAIKQSATEINEILPKPVASVREHTTARLQEYQQQEQQQNAKTDTP